MMALGRSQFIGMDRDGDLRKSLHKKGMPDFFMVRYLQFLFNSNGAWLATIEAALPSTEARFSRSQTRNLWLSGSLTLTLQTGSPRSCRIWRTRSLETCHWRAMAASCSYSHLTDKIISSVTMRSGRPFLSCPLTTI